MSLSPQFLDELRHRTLLSSLIGRSVKLQKAGREYKGCCPFHNEKTPSFYVNDDKGFYHCFGCSAHGDAIKFLIENQGLPFIEAVNELAAAAGMNVPAPDPRAAEQAQRQSGLAAANEAAAKWFSEQLDGVEGASARTYLEHRGIPKELAATFQIGFAPDARGKLKSALSSFGDDTLIEAGLLIDIEGKEPYDRFRGRVIIPIRDARGRTIAFGGRILAQGEPKYLNSPDTPLFDKGRTLFNIDRAGPASRKADRLIVVEGYMDVIALAKAGIDEVVAPNGTAITEPQFERMWRLSEVPILCLDGDKAGRKAAARAAAKALPMVGPGHSLRIVLLPDGLDPDELIQQGGVEAFDAVLAEGMPLDEFIWQNELTNAEIETPEGRAAFAKRLRDLAGTIVDDDTKTLYLGRFKQRHHELFNAEFRASGDRSYAGRWLKDRRQAHPELVAISKLGMAKAVFAPAALKGLRRFPSVISSHAETVGHLPALLAHRDLRLICQEMLYAALTFSPLESTNLEAILHAAGLATQLDRAEKRQRVPFSFLRANVDPEVAKRDLAYVLDHLHAAPEIQAEVEAATNRLRQDADDAAFKEQVRVQIIRQTLNDELADLLQRQYAST